MDEATRRRLVAAYESKAEARNARSEPTWRDGVVDEFLERLPAGSRVLDLGAGTGRYAARLAEEGMSVTAVDLTPAHVEMCREKGLDAAVVDFTRDDLGEDRYDAVWALNSLLHVPKAQLGDVLERIRRCLVPGGLAMICVWGGIEFEGPREGEGYDPPRFLSFMTDEQFLALPTPGFERLETRFLDVVDENETHPQLMWLRRV